MSRTYRRKGAEGDHTWYFERLRDSRYDEKLGVWYFPYNDDYSTYDKRSAEVKRRAYLAHFYTESYRTMTTPMWWYRETMQVPYRRKVRDLNHDVLKMRTIDEMEAVVYPDYKRPHNYYW